MINGLDHVAVAVEDFAGAVDGYRRLLGREPDLEDDAGSQRAWFRFPGADLEVISPAGAGESGDRVRGRLAADGEGLWLLAFTVEDLAEADRLLRRRGFDTSLVSGGAGVLAQAAGLQLGFRPARDSSLSPAIGADGAAISGLDHVAFRTPNPDRAVAIYGGRLGLDLRLDRTTDAFNTRMLFFAVGDLRLEFSAGLKARANDGPDSFGGLAWRVPDPRAARARLVAAGFDVSELRPGAGLGTHVFTVRDAPAGVPTLILSANPLPESR